MDCEILSEAPKAILPSELLNLVKHFEVFCTTSRKDGIRNRYDPNEWFFPGSGYLDGTVEGAMKAGLEAYPP